MIDFLLYLILISIYYGESEEKRKKNPTKNIQWVIFVTFKNKSYQQLLCSVAPKLCENGKFVYIINSINIYQ